MTVPEVRARLRFRPGRGSAARDLGAGRRRRAGRPVPDPARHHRLREVVHDRRPHRRGAAADADPGARTRAWPPSWPPSSGSSSRRTGSSTSSRTTTTTSPRRTCPSTDTFIEKDSSINDEIDRLRHSATSALLSRRDVVIVASVSAIYGLGSPETYAHAAADPQGRRGARPARRSCAGSSSSSTSATTMSFVRNKFRVRGDTIEIFPAYEERGIRVQLFGDEVERIASVDPLTGEIFEELGQARALPGVALRHPGRADAHRDRGHRGRARGAARSGSRTATSCSRRSGSACAPPTTSR